MHGGGAFAGRGEGTWSRSPAISPGSAGNLPGYTDARMPGHGKGGSNAGLFADAGSALNRRPPSREDVSRAQSHLVLLKSKIRQGKTGPIGNASASVPPKRSAEPHLRNGRFEYVASGAGDDGAVASGMSSSGRHRPKPRVLDGSPRAGGMTWDAPAVHNEESPIHAIGSRAAAPSQARIPAEEMPAYSSATAGSGLRGGAGGTGRADMSRATSLNSPDAYPEARDNGPMFPCPDCGRKFNAESIERHVKICKKVFQSKRTKFSSVATRLGELDNAQELIAKAQRDDRTPSAASQKKERREETVPAWKKKSLEFRAAILSAKAATGDEEAQAKAEEVAQQLSMAGNRLDPDKIKCQHCGRTFNKEAGERHIAICVKTFGKKPGGGRLVRGGGQLMQLAADKRSTPTGSQSLNQYCLPANSGNASSGRPQGASSTVPPSSTSTAQSAQVSRTSSSGQGVAASGNSVVRTSSGGFPPGGYPNFAAGSAAPSAQNRRPSAHRAQSRGGSIR